MALAALARCSLWSSTAGRCVAVLLSFPISLLGTQAMRGWAHGWVARPPLAARAALLGIRTRIEGEPPRRRRARRGQAPVDVRDAGDHAAARRAGDRAEARARRHPALGLGGAALWRHPGRPRRRRRGAAADDARRRGGDRRRPADRHLPRRHAGRRRASSRRSSPASPASTARSSCRSCRWRWTAAGSGRATASSSGRASSPSASASRSRPACRAPRSRRRSTRRSTRWRRRRDARARPDRGLFRPALVLGRPAEAVRFLAPARLSLLSLRAQGRRLSAPPLAGAASRRRSWRSSPPSRDVCRARRRPLRHRPQPVRAPPPSRTRLAGGARAPSSPSSTRLKPDDLAILFDDMRGDVPDLAERQAAIVHFAAERSGAGADHLLPLLLFGRSDPRRRLRRAPASLSRAARPPARSGDPASCGPARKSCSREYSPGHLARVAEQLGRKPFLWDNYPVNDGPRMSQHLHLRAFTGRPAAIAPHHRRPRHQPRLAAVLSRIPALTLAESYARGRRL